MTYNAFRVKCHSRNSAIKDFSCIQHHCMINWFLHIIRLFWLEFDKLLLCSSTLTINVKEPTSFTSLYFSFSGHSPAMLYPTAVEKKPHMGYSPLEEYTSKDHWYPLIFFMVKKKSSIKQFFFSSGLKSFVSMMQSFNLKSCILKKCQTKTMCCILILIFPELQWVMGGRNLPLISPTINQFNTLSIQIKD